MILSKTMNGKWSDEICHKAVMSNPGSGQFGPGEFGPGQFGPGQFGTRTIWSRNDHN